MYRVTQSLWHYDHREGVTYGTMITERGVTLSAQYALTVVPMCLMCECRWQERCDCTRPDHL